MSARQSLCINIPVAAYDAINTKGHLPPQLCRTVASYVAARGFSRLLLFGGSRTGQAIKTCLGERFRGFVDTASLGNADPNQADGILITTAPIHTKQIRESLRKSPLAGLPVITLFASEKKNIRLILETQPRSGTDYTINNLRRTLNLGYASNLCFSRRAALRRWAPGLRTGAGQRLHRQIPLYQTVTLSPIPVCPNTFSDRFFPGYLL